MAQDNDPNEIDRLWRSLPGRSAPKPYWDRAPWTRPAHLPWGFKLDRPHYVPVPAPPPAPPPTPQPAQPSRSGFALLASETEHKQRDRRAEALRQLTAFVQNWPSAFQLARLCLHDTGHLDFTELDASVAAACAHKATSTIVRRLHSLAAYATWSKLHNSPPFPPSERNVWGYVSDTSIAQPHTKASGLLEALNWAKGVLGLTLPEEVPRSPRIHGLVQGRALHAAPVRRAPALPVVAIRALELLTTTSTDPRDRVTAGAVLFGIFACARASDLARATTLQLDHPPEPAGTTWIQASVAQSKTAIGGRGRLALPLVAPVVALDRPWCRAWLQAREALGLPCHGPIPAGSLIPAFHPSGMPAPTPLTSRQLSQFLRASLPPEVPLAPTSHSIKTTCLTWAAVAGVTLDHRRLLGHHVHDSARSTETYSRDVLMPAARQLEAVLL